MKQIDKHNKNWWKPKKLTESQKTFISNNDLKDLNTDNDFGSYKFMRLRDDVEGSKIAFHNELQPSYRVEEVFKILKNRNVQDILDVGCGLGFTTNELMQKFENANVSGVDISEDAIKYANEKFKCCNFFCEAIDPSNKKQKFNYDLVTAFEFYPFTRTDSFEDHSEYIEHLTKNLRKGGALVIFQVFNDNETIFKNLFFLKKRFVNLDFEDHMIPLRILRKLYLPRLILLSFSNILCYFSKLILGRSIARNKLIIISKSTKSL